LGGENLEWLVSCEDQRDLIRHGIHFIPCGPVDVCFATAWKDFWRIFDSYQGLRGVVHSFSSGTKQLDAALGRGLYIGLNGIMTFTRDEAQLQAARQVPADRMLLETDAPFLTPAAHRGDICEPKHIVDIAEFLAKLRGESTGELSKSTTDNAVRLFNLK